MTNIDSIDRNILRELDRDGRISNVSLADKVGLSPSACLRRVQELERTGIIQGYRAVLDRSQLGGGFLVYVAVGLSRHTQASQELFEKAISRSPAVRECFNVSGTIEYLLRVEVEDMAAYKHFHTEVLGRIETVNSITSYIVMGTPKDERS
ncbi:MAG: winged helix-turn-helix transcriptional regulator [Hyphomonadaceae bacterium]|nr:winged helix-turn-helix transcriptional regulator [Hyphomonadaceae bacterium]